MLLQVTPNHVHGLPLESQRVLFDHPAPFVDTNKSTSAARSVIAQSDRREVQFVMQFDDQTEPLAGNAVLSPGGTLPVNWLKAKLKVLQTARDSSPDLFHCS